MSVVAILDTIFRAQNKFGPATRGAMGDLARLNRAITGTRNLLLGLGSALAVRAVVNSLGQTAEAIDRTAKVSDRIGIATEHLIGLRHAAELAGVPIDSFDAALTKMGRNLIDQPKAFEAIGMNAQELAKLPLDQVFLKTADAIARLQSPAQRVNAAMEIFGKQGAELVPMLQDGGDAIAAMEKRAAQLGITFSRIDAAKMEAANDALQEAGKVIEGVKQQIVIGLAPFIKAAADAFIDFATSGEGAAAKIVDAMESVAVAIASIIDLTSRASYGFRLLAAGIQASAEGGPIPIDPTKLEAYYERQRNRTAELAGPANMTSAADVMETFARIRNRAQQAAEKAAADADKRRAVGRPQFTSPQNLGAGMGSIASIIGGDLKNVSKILKDFADSLSEARSRADEFEKIVQGTFTPLDKYTKTMAMIQELEDHGFNKADAARFNALKELEQGLPESGGPRTAGAALEFGTAAGFSAEKASPKKQLETQKQILAEAQKQNVKLDAAVKAFREGGVVLADF